MSMSEPHGPIIGIDLGTTNSVVATVVNGQPRVLSEGGERILPSVVGLDARGQLVTGITARNQLAAFPERTQASIKRRMGSMEPVQLGSEQFTPPEISAVILRRLKDWASRALGQPVSRAVITVPAFFDDRQRQATREAGVLAGLKVERIINEPTAVTLVYHTDQPGPRTVVVYDFGGGTFDVSIVRMEQGVIEVLTSKGDTHLGGDDLDEALLNSIADEFLDREGCELRQEATTRYRLLQACERAKCRLSTEETVTLAEEFIAEKNGLPLHLNRTLTRSEFEDLIAPFVDRTIACVDEALRDAGVSVQGIDDLLLVGGSTRIPMVEQRLRAEFQREPSRAVDPDLAVALGAAVQGALLDGQSVETVLVDVTSHTLGLEALDHTSLTEHLIFTPIIHRNSPLPARFERAFWKVYDEQERAEIHVLQGESTHLNLNRSVGKLMLKLESGGGTKSKVVVRFDLTLDGVLEVTATQPATGRSKRMVIENALSEFQGEQRERAAARLDALFDADGEAGAGAAVSLADAGQTSAALGDLPDDWEQVGAAYQQAAELVRKAQAMLSKVSTEDAEDIRELCQELRGAMEARDGEQLASLCLELDDLLFYVQ